MKEKVEAYSETSKTVLEIFQKDVAKHKPLNRTQEEALKKEYATASLNRRKTIKDTFITSNLRLAYSKALKYQNLGLTVEDLIQEAVLGLCRAVEEFDWKVATRFTTYAGYWIQAALTEAIQNKSRLVRMPVNHQHAIAAEKKANAGESETLAKSIKIVNIHKPINEDADCMVDIIVNPYADAPDAAFKKEFKSTLDVFMKTILDAREQQIIKELFGINQEYAKPLEDVAQQLNMSAERVRQIQNQALKKMQKMKHHLHVF
jgi:RNA polymerase primary sigma factor